MSVNWEHSSSFYTQQTVLQMEWQTGKDEGYVRWYHEDKLIYEITADMLKSKPGASDTIAQIPYEAMYLILNTDISPRWGWNGCNPNDPCMQENPGLCSGEGELLCRVCSNPDCLKCPETTGWLEDFCQDISRDDPAEYKIDYIRVYQDANDTTHTVGCDPPVLPTKGYVEENWERYTFDPFMNKQPLRTVQRGGGTCSESSECGIDPSTQISKGLCRDGICECLSDWTGPNCLSPCTGEYAECGESANASQVFSSAVSVKLLPLLLLVVPWIL